MRKEQKQEFPFHTPSPLSAGNDVQGMRSLYTVHCTVQCTLHCTVQYTLQYSAVYSEQGRCSPRNLGTVGTFLSLTQRIQEAAGRITNHANPGKNERFFAPCVGRAAPPITDKTNIRSLIIMLVLLLLLLLLQYVNYYSRCRYLSLAL